MSLLGSIQFYVKFNEDWEVIENSPSINEILSLEGIIGADKSIISKNLQIETGSVELEIPEGSGEFYECSINKVNKNIILTGFSSKEHNLLKLQLSDIEMIADRNINKLQKVNNLLEDANIVKEQFLSKVSHELRTPLNAIMGFSEVLKKNNYLDPEYYVNLIDSNSKLLFTYVEDLLLFSKNNNSEIHLKPKPYSPSHILKGIKELVGLNPEYTNKDLQFETFCNLNTEYVVGDVVRINQIIINLVNNALKFTQNGFVRLSFLEKDNKLIIKVEDSGIGMSDTDKEGIFEEFIQLDSGNQHKGLGLGLSIVKSIVDKMGGDINVESNLGLGTTFIISLPLIVSLDRDLTFQAKEYNIADMNLLYVEDSLINQKVLKAFLNTQNHNIFLASNVNQGLEHIANENFDAIFVDVNLGNEDGKELIRNIRKQKVFTPIVSLTAHSLDSEKEKCFKSGADYFLTKPYTINDLNESLKYCQEISNEIEKGDYVKQFSKIDSLQNKIIVLSLNELKGSINLLLQYDFENFEINLKDFLHKSKTAVSAINDSTINTLFEGIDKVRIDSVSAVTKIKTKVYLINNQCERLLRYTELNFK